MVHTCKSSIREIRGRRFKASPGYIIARGQPWLCGHCLHGNYSEERGARIMAGVTHAETASHYNHTKLLSDVPGNQSGNSSSQMSSAALLQLHGSDNASVSMERTPTVLFLSQTYKERTSCSVSASSLAIFYIHKTHLFSLPL